MMKCSTGVRVAVRTHATTLSLRVRCTQLATEDGNRIASNSFVAAVDGVDHTEVPTPLDADALIPLSGGELIEASRRAESSLVSFEGLPPGDKTVEVWLPQGAIVDLLAIESDAPVDPAPMPPGRTWLHHGSSISHCIEPQRPTSTWPVVAARAAGVSVVNLSGAGQCHLDPFMSDAIAQTPADVISLKLGVNNVGGRSMDQRTFVSAVHGFIDRIRQGHPTTPIVVVSPIFADENEDRPGPTAIEPTAHGTQYFRFDGDTSDIQRGALTLPIVREHLRYVVGARQQLGEDISYLDGLSLYGPDDAGAAPLPDGIHPDTAIYEEMGRRFATLVFGPTGLIPGNGRPRRPPDHGGARESYPS